MGLRHTGFSSDLSIDAPVARANGQRLIELFVAPAFSDLELASVIHTLSAANDILGTQTFEWTFVSDTPGLVAGASGMMVQADPVASDVGHCDFLVVVGGANAVDAKWLHRVRAMQRMARPVVLLSHAATAYIKATKASSGKVTTHWRDIDPLTETGFHPNLTARFSEVSDGVITAAGAGATCELVIGLIAPLLNPAQIAELGNHLLLQTIRKSDAEQPRKIADNEGLFDTHVTRAIRLMEDTISDQISLAILTQKLGLSDRHLGRIFRQAFDETPARFYKRLRTKHARKLIEETLLPLTEIAVATGFDSCTALSKSIKAEYGLSPSKMRTRKTIDLLRYSAS